MPGVKETICSSCVHLNVCKYKDELLSIAKNINDSTANNRFSCTINCEDYIIRSSPESTSRTRYFWYDGSPM